MKKKDFTEVSDSVTLIDDTLGNIEDSNETKLKRYNLENEILDENGEESKNKDWENSKDKREGKTGPDRF